MNSSDQTLENQIIGTVVRDGPATAEVVADKLIGEGRDETREEIVAAVSAIADLGQIARNEAGLYEGV